MVFVSSTLQAAAEHAWTAPALWSTPMTTPPTNDLALIMHEFEHEASVLQAHLPERWAARVVQLSKLQTNVEASTTCAQAPSVDEWAAESITNKAAHCANQGSKGTGAESNDDAHGWAAIATATSVIGTPLQCVTLLASVPHIHKRIRKLVVHDARMLYNESTSWAVDAIMSVLSAPVGDTETPGRCQLTFVTERHPNLGQLLAWCHRTFSAFVEVCNV
ncbi:MAG: hypothetical protein EOO65_00255, partial [Methanosarcinales archaeon]